ncbi:emerin homolog 1-like isoform X3 [Tachypleus tridentatus]|uniref:emerin homolog 1-like isoform X3 n=1 Tax=Tachypleus tridentatus TaxID=6853 RepID=UPI003FD0D019
MLIVDGVNISKLTDDELFQKLRQLGVNAGPIIESTRAVYERKLAQLLKGEPQVESSSYLDQDTLDQEYFHTHESELHRRLLLTANSPEPFSGYGLNRTKRTFRMNQDALD